MTWTRNILSYTAVALVSMLSVVGAHPTAMRWRQEIQLPAPAPEAETGQSSQSGSEAEARTLVLIVDGRVLSTAEVDRMRRSMNDRREIEQLQQYETRRQGGKSDALTSGASGGAATLLQPTVISRATLIALAPANEIANPHSTPPATPRRTRAP